MIFNFKWLLADGDIARFWGLSGRFKWLRSCFEHFLTLLIANDPSALQQRPNNYSVLLGGGAVWLAIYCNNANAMAERPKLCEGDELVHAELTHDKLEDVLSLNIPCDYFYGGFRGYSGPQKSVRIAFAEGSLEPYKSYEAQDQSKHKNGEGRRGVISLRLSRSANPDMGQWERERLDKMAKITVPEIDAITDAFDVFVSPAAPKPAYHTRVYPRDRSIKTNFLCRRNGYNALSTCEGRVYYRGLSIKYGFRLRDLPRWQDIEKQAKALTDRLIVE